MFKVVFSNNNKINNTFFSPKYKMNKSQLHNYLYYYATTNEFQLL